MVAQNLTKFCTYYVANSKYPIYNLLNFVSNLGSYE